MLGEGDGSPGNVHKFYKMLTKISQEQKNRTKRDADDDKRASMTMNEREGSSHRLLIHLSTVSPRYLADLPQHRGVCAETYVEYVQSMDKVRAKSTRDYGPHSPRGGV